MMTYRQKQFQTELFKFPKFVHRILQSIPRQAGRLFARQCTELIDHLEIDLEQLMTRLLPLAKIYAVAPVSRFQVGAVVMAGAGDKSAPADLFLGANIEFRHQPLNQTIHAEQSAALHAWQQGAQNLRAIATSQAPCGYCRQFLYEFENNVQMRVIAPDGENAGYHQTALSNLLPEAFGPSDLDNPTGLMASAAADRIFSLPAEVKDRLAAEALAAAEKSYAPYTQNFAGCGLQTSSGDIFKGRYAESTAFNPSLTALHSAILCLNMATFETEQSVQRVVLVEKPTRINQRRAAELLLETWAPGIDLEYYEIT
ncbi:MAG: cytidine deaminase [Desulfobacterales bacterium]|jgi:cytidine deaminase